MTMPRSQSYAVSNASSSPARPGRSQREARMGSYSDSSDDEDELADTVRKLRFSISRTPSRKISVLSSVNPSPRVSMFEGPNISMLDTPQEEKQADYLELRKEATARLIGAILVVITIVQLVIIIYLLTKAKTAHYCSSESTEFFVPRDFKNPGIFDDLTPDELNAVNRFMLDDKLLQLSKGDVATINSSYIYMIELFMPNKTDVLLFIDRGRTQPQREAKVVVFRGNMQPPRVEEYIVSLLPRPTSYRLYKNPSFRRDPIPFNSRPSDRIEATAAGPLIASLTKKLYPLLMESYGLCFHNCTKGVNCLKVFDTAPRGVVSGDRKTWVWFFPEIDGFYSQPLGLEILINHESIDTSQWSADQIVYNGQAFSSAESLMEAYWLGRVQKIIYHYDGKQNTLHEEQRYGDQQPGPRHFEPSGKRFLVSGQLINYNNWQFNFNMRPSTGLQLYNVLFAGSRLAYEISLQEVVVFYTGYGPTQSNSNVYDSSEMIGASSMELVKGIDCPGDAAFIDSYFWVNDGIPKRTRNNICVFERNSEVPIHRHYTDDYEDGYEYYTGTPNNHLVVRTIASIWNYDYIFDYIFYNNGAIEVKVSLTGFVQSTFVLHEEKEYGYAMNEFGVADLHQHLFNFKVDLDIAGDLNRYTVEDIETETVDHPWLSNQTQLQMKMKKTLIQTESVNNTDNFNTIQYHLFHNKNAKNKYGADRSYRILNKSPVIDLLSEKGIAKAAPWSKYPITVTRRRDSEPQSSSIYAQNDPWDPVLDFEDFIDDESLVDEDLVAWVTLGTYHIPGTEDVPMTSTVWNQYSFFLAPHNYFWRSPDTGQGDTLKMKPRDKASSDRGAEIVSNNDNVRETKCVPPPNDPTDYDGRRS